MKVNLISCNIPFCEFLSLKSNNSLVTVSSYLELDLGHSTMSVTVRFIQTTENSVWLLVSSIQPVAATVI